VHTDRMKCELMADFGVAEEKINIIPHGINQTAPNTELTGAQARERLGLKTRDKVILFFGYIAPYKGLEFLVAAFSKMARRNPTYRLVIAGAPKENNGYWTQIQELISGSGVSDRIIQKIEFISEADTEIYFKAADVLALPYRHIFQSGVLFLAYSFGLPVIAADVGSLKEEIIEGKTGFVYQNGNGSLARTIEDYFESDLYLKLEQRRHSIQRFASERYSWSKVAAATMTVYSQLSPQDQERPIVTIEKSDPLVSILIPAYNAE